MDEEENILYLGDTILTRASLRRPSDAERITGSSCLARRLIRRHKSPIENKSECRELLETSPAKQWLRVYFLLVMKLTRFGLR